jgi:hypothetical protein
MHVISTGGPRGWQFDGNLEAPTFSPSILVTGIQPLTEDEYAQIAAGEKIEPRPLRCHTFVRAGQIQYLGDCTHDLRGQTVPLPDLPAELVSDD